MKLQNIIVIVLFAAIISACRDPKQCVTITCFPSCAHLNDDDYCRCNQDSINAGCLFNHSDFYDYYSCNCQCARGWTGNRCNQRDTTYYATFLFGTDTLDLDSVSTHSFFADFNSWKFFEFDNSNLPSGYKIDSVILSQLPPLDTNRYTFCDTSASCIRMKALFLSGDSAIAVSGFGAIDTLTGIFQLKGTFEANLSTVTGSLFYIREGRYFITYW